MRVAVLILGLAFLLAIILWALLGASMLTYTQISAGTPDVSPPGMASGGTLIWVALLYLVGSAFALGRPGISTAVFAVTTVVCFVQSLEAVLWLYPLWGMISLVLTILSYLGYRERRPTNTLSPG